MSELRLETWTMSAADLGPENPLPPLPARSDAQTGIEFDPQVPEDERRYVGYGRPPCPLPYRMQDGYDRGRRPRAFRAAVLENDTLRATFLLELGGRLWSLVHKPSGEEMLHTPPMFQPGNLAIRNAWFCGGVEWNVGVSGHCVFTCAPVFVARVVGPGDTPMLRLYEFERIRGVPFQVDAWLPDGSPVLFVRVRLVNPGRGEVPMYWWSNMAVPETPHTRVIAPADTALKFGQGRRLNMVPVDGPDVTRPRRYEQPGDFFFRVPRGRRPWITAVDERGRGLVQTSTARLRGRKFFYWGTGEASARRQEFLSGPGRGYIEIQAGLARTQAEHLPMPAGAVWEWTEAYGRLEADPAAVQYPDWARAQRDVEERLEALIPAAALEVEHARASEAAGREPAEIVQHGSGWGALEQARHRAAGEPPLAPTSLPFPDETLGVEQTPWLALLRGGALPRPTEDSPGAFMVQREWRDLLEAALRAGRCDHAFAWYHLGVMRHQAGEAEGAREAWRRALAGGPNAWASAALAVLERESGRPDEAAAHALDALRTKPDLAAMAVECGRTLLRAGRPAAWLDALGRLPDAVRRSGRVRTLEAQAALAQGDADRVERILADPAVLVDQREGEKTLVDLWYGLHEERLSRGDGAPKDETMRQRVRRDFPPPATLLLT